GIVNGFVPAVIPQAINEAAMSSVAEHIDVVKAPIIPQSGSTHFYYDGTRKWNFLAVGASRVADDYLLSDFITRFGRQWFFTNNGIHLENPCRSLPIIVVTGTKCDLRKSGRTELWLDFPFYLFPNQSSDSASAKDIGELKILLPLKNSFLSVA